MSCVRGEPDLLQSARLPLWTIVVFFLLASVVNRRREQEEWHHQMLQSRKVHSGQALEGGKTQQQCDVFLLHASNCKVQKTGKQRKAFPP